MDKGLVCDKCNNYFARKVEKPFLEDSTLKLLRFAEGLESKKGKVPPVSAVMNGKHAVTLWKDINDKFAGHVDVPVEVFKTIKNSNHKRYALRAIRAIRA